MIVALRGCETIAREKFMVRYSRIGQRHPRTREIILGQRTTPEKERERKSISPSSPFSLFLPTFVLSSSLASGVYQNDLAHFYKTFFCP